jgi:hypothetical protein
MLTEDDYDMVLQQLAEDTNFEVIEAKCVKAVANILKTEGKIGIKNLLVSERNDDILLRKCYDACLVGRLHTKNPSLPTDPTVCFLCYDALPDNKRANSHIVDHATLKRLRKSSLNDGKNIACSKLEGAQVAMDISSNSSTVTYPLMCVTCDNKTGDCIESKVFPADRDIDLTESTNMAVLRYAIAYTFRVFTMTPILFCHNVNAWILVDKMRKYLIWSIWGWKLATGPLQRDFNFWTIPMPQRVQLFAMNLKIPSDPIVRNLLIKYIPDALKDLIFLNSKISQLVFPTETFYGCAHGSCMFIFSNQIVDFMDSVMYPESILWAVKKPHLDYTPPDLNVPVVAVAASPSKYHCETCLQRFVSRNRLFVHLEASHDVVRAVKPDEGTDDENAKAYQFYRSQFYRSQFASRPALKVSEDKAAVWQNQILKDILCFESIDHPWIFDAFLDVDTGIVSGFLNAGFLLESDVNHMVLLHLHYLITTYFGPFLVARDRVLKSPLVADTRAKYLQFEKTRFNTMVVQMVFWLCVAVAVGFTYRFLFPSAFDAFSGF